MRVAHRHHLHKATGHSVTGTRFADEQPGDREMREGAVESFRTEVVEASMKSWRRTAQGSCCPL